MSYASPGGGAEDGAALAVVPAGVAVGLVGALPGAGDPRAAFILSTVSKECPNALCLVKKDRR